MSTSRQFNKQILTTNTAGIQQAGHVGPMIVDKSYTVTAGSYANSGYYGLFKPSTSQVAIVCPNNYSGASAEIGYLTDAGTYTTGLYMDRFGNVYIGSGNVITLDRFGNITANQSINGATGTIGNFGSTSVTANNLFVTGNITSGGLSVGSVTAGTISLSGNMNIAGTLNVVNITTTNLTDTNITAGVILATTGITAASIRVTNGSFTSTFNSNTIGNLYTTGGNIGINTISPSAKLHVQGSQAFIGDINSGFSLNVPSNPGSNTTWSGARLFFDNSYNTTAGTGAPANKIVLYNNNFTAGFGIESQAVTYHSGYAHTFYGNATSSNTYGNTLMMINGNGYVGINSTNPVRMLSMYGAGSSITGPHVWVNTSDSQTNPIFHQLNYSADNVSLNFDMYYDGQFRNSNSTTAFQIYKNNSQMRFTYQNGSAGTVNGQTTSLCLGSSGNVGIGNNNPSTYLNVQAGSGNGYNSDYGIVAFETSSKQGISMGYDSTKGSSWIYSRSVGVAPNGLSISTNNVITNIFCATNGIVGIATTNPQSTLDVNGNLFVNYNGASSGLPLIRMSPSTNGNEASIGFYQNTSNSGAIWVVGHNPGSAGNGNFGIYNTSYGANVMMMTSRGNVGIGTNSPVSTSPGLTIQADGTGVWATDTGNGQLIITGATNTNKRIGFMIDTTNNVGIIQSGLTGTGQYPLCFNPGANQGQIGVNTTSCSANLTVNGSSVFIGSGTANVKVNNTSAIPTTTAVMQATGVVSTRCAFATYMAASTSQNHIEFVNSNGVVGNIATNGSATVYSTSSDYRLKENVIEYDSGLDAILNIKPVSYNFKTDKTTEVGFIAHEVQSVIPEAVIGEKDDINEDGSIKAQSVDYGRITPYLASAVQQLYKKLKELEDKLDYMT